MQSAVRRRHHPWMTVLATALLLGACTATAPETTAPQTMTAAPTTGTTALPTPKDNGSGAAGTADGTATGEGSAAPETSGTVRTSTGSESSGSSGSETSRSTATPEPTVAPRAADSASLQVTEADRAAAVELATSMTTRELAGAVIMANSADAVDTDTVAELGLGGVILMGSDGVVDGTATGSPDEVAAVTAALQDQVPDGDFPLLIATDQEFGVVQRLRNGFTDFPEASAYRGAGDAAPDLVRRSAEVAGAEMSAVGITVNFAPDADLLTSDAATYDGTSAIGDRSYGSDPEMVGTLAAAAVTGYQAAGVAATLKHFPGIGGISTDTHDALPTSTVDCTTWTAGDAAPFRTAIEAGAALVMTGHVLLPAATESGLPASLSPTVVTDLLRGSGAGDCAGLGFTGVTVTDALEMAPVSGSYGPGEAAVHALTAGEDLLLMPVDPQAAVDGIVAAVEDGTLDPARLLDAATRVLTLRAATGHVLRPELSVVGSAAHLSISSEVAAALTE